MIRKAALLTAVLAVLTLAGCCGDRVQVFSRGVEGYADAILPEYEKYVDADPALTPGDRKIRRDSVSGLRTLLQSAKDSGGK